MRSCYFHSASLNHVWIDLSTHLFFEMLSKVLLCIFELPRVWFDLRSKHQVAAHCRFLRSTLFWSEFLLHNSVNTHSRDLSAAHKQERTHSKWPWVPTTLRDAFRPTDGPPNELSGTRSHFARFASSFINFCCAPDLKQVCSFVVSVIKTCVSASCISRVVIAACTCYRAMI